MGGNTVTFIISTVAELYVFMVVLRFLLQLAHADYYNPISQAIARFTDVPVRSISRVVPRIAGKYDISAFLYAVVIKLITIVLLVTVTGAAMPGALHLILWSIIGVFNLLLTIYFWAIIASVAISWIAPGSYHPGPQLIQQITEPVLGLARKVIPPIGGLDLSPILVILLIRIIQMQLGG